MRIKKKYIIITAVILILAILVIPTISLVRAFTDGKTETKSGNKFEILSLEKAKSIKEIEPVEYFRYEITDEEKRMISVTAWNADHTDDESLTCVIQTILNRVFETDKFPNTVEEVLKQRKQFESCEKILYDKKDYDYNRVTDIINLVCAGEDVFGGELVLFYSAAYVKPSRIARGLVLVKESGGSKFYKQN